MTVQHQQQPQSGFRPADRIAAIGLSEILQIGARAGAMKAAGKPVIILGAVEPDRSAPSPHPRRRG